MAICSRGNGGQYFVADSAETNGLKGAPLEDYSLQILRQWGIGNKEKNNGVLMLISTGDRKSRIEVGYGLEGALTDGVTGQIQDQYMIPYFRKGNYEEGIARGYEALARRIAKEYNVHSWRFPVTQTIRRMQ